ASLYVDEWFKMLAEAEERQNRELDAPARAALRSRLRHKELKTRLSAAANLAREFLDQKKLQQPRDIYFDDDARTEHIAKLNDGEMDQFMKELFDRLLPGRGAPK